MADGWALRLCSCLSLQFPIPHSRHHTSLLTTKNSWSWLIFSSISFLLHFVFSAWESRWTPDYLLHKAELLSVRASGPVTVPCLFLSSSGVILRLPDKFLTCVITLRPDVFFPLPGYRICPPFPPSQMVLLCCVSWWSCSCLDQISLHHFAEFVPLPDSLLAWFLSLGLKKQTLIFCRTDSVPLSKPLNAEPDTLILINFSRSPLYRLVNGYVYVIVNAICCSRDDYKAVLEFWQAHFYSADFKSA